jgi:hypothetical protein
MTFAPDSVAAPRKTVMSGGLRHKGYNLSTGKTTSVLLFTIVSVGHNFPKDDP